MGQATPPPKLTPTEKNQWNAFIDFMDKSGYKGNTQLDNRDQNVGQYLFSKFKTQNPSVTLTYNDVPRVQQELQNYRNQIIQQYKTGKVTSDDTIKDPDTEIMPGLSKVDGWLGSKTSSYKFPTAVAIHTDNTHTNYGTDTDAFDNRLATNK